jgi:transcriptional regulator NrdR family protein
MVSQVSQYLTKAGRGNDCFRVTDTRNFDTYIRRRYRCGKCQHRWTTKERVSEADLIRALAHAGDYQI